jgi:hypothetical protein
MRAIPSSLPSSALGRAAHQAVPAEARPKNTFTRKAPGGAADTDGVRRGHGLPPMPATYVRDLVKSGSTYALRQILETKEKYGIDVNAAAPETGNRLLHDAFEHIDSHPVQSDIVKLLLGHGGDPNLRNDQGLTALDVATHRAKPNPHAIGQLLNNGAEVSEHAMDAGLKSSRETRWLYFMLRDELQPK